MGGLATFWGRLASRMNYMETPCAPLASLGGPKGAPPHGLPSAIPRGWNPAPWPGQGAPYRFALLFPPRPQRDFLGTLGAIITGFSGTGWNTVESHGIPCEF